MTINKFYSPQSTMSGGGEQISEAELKWVKASKRLPKRDGDYNARYAINRCVVDIREGRVYEVRGLARLLDGNRIDLDYLEWLDEFAPAECAKDWVKEKYNAWLKMTGLDKDSYPALVALNCVAFLMYDTDPVIIPEPSEQSRPDAFLEWLGEQAEAAEKQATIEDRKMEPNFSWHGRETALEEAREKYLSLHAHPSIPSIKPEREETKIAAAISSAALGSYLQDHPEDRWEEPSPAVETLDIEKIGMEELWKEFSEKVEIFDPNFNAISQTYPAQVLFKGPFSDLFMKVGDAIHQYCEDKASLQSQLSEAREDKEANIKRALEIAGERDRAIDEAREYRKVLERINEKWEILSKPAIVIAVRAALDKYPSPQNHTKQ